MGRHATFLHIKRAALSRLHSWHGKKGCLVDTSLSMCSFLLLFLGEQDFPSTVESFQVPLPLEMAPGQAERSRVQPDLFSACLGAIF
uniref:Uncharacterized protein n=1 Tax=Laticauda laticaudata TaxID=8630 RepID=A0A8C5SL29_LATLA